MTKYQIGAKYLLEEQLLDIYLINCCEDIKNKILKMLKICEVNKQDVSMNLQKGF